jgi:autotransporter-associated beta strand protein
MNHQPKNTMNHELDPLDRPVPTPFARGAALAAALAVMAAVGARAATVTDDFSTSRDYLTAGVSGTIWDGIHNQSAANVLNTTGTAGQLTIGTPSSAVGWDGTHANAPLLYKNVTGDFDVRVQATAGTTANYTIAGLLVRLDPANADGNAGEDFVMLTRNWGSGIAGNQLRSVNDNAQSDSGITTAQAYLRLTRTGNVFRGYTSSDGTTWTQRAWGGGLDLTRADLGGTVQLGLTEGAFVAGNVTWVRYDNFTLITPDAVAVTSPTNGQAFAAGSSVSATATVAFGAAPHTVEFHTTYNGGAASSAGTSTTPPYTVNLGTLAAGTYTIYATATDSATPTPATATSATNTFTVAPDTTAPTPDPMTFAIAPASASPTSITMTATTATDALSPPVQYYFENTTNSDNSGWISSTVWTNTGLTAGTTYGYRVMARDSATPPNETAFSAVSSVYITANATITWDANGTGDGQTDGAGTWLAASQWWDGFGNPSWNNSLPSNAVIGNGGAGGTITLGAVTAGSVAFDNFTGTYTLTGGSLSQSGGITVASTAGDVTLGSAIGGAGGLTMNGSGTLILAMDNNSTFTGSTTINSGTLTVAEHFGVGGWNRTLNGPVVVNSGATLRWNWHDQLASAATLTVNGGTADLQGYEDYIGTLTLQNGGQLLGTGATNDSFVIIDGPAPTILGSGGGNAGSISAPIAVTSQWAIPAGARTLRFDVDAATTLTVSGKIINTGLRNTTLTYAGSISKTGDGTLVLSGANTYTGTTTVSGGSLALGASNVLPDVSAVMIGNATLDADTFTDTVGTLDVTGAATIDLSTGTLAFAGSSAVDWTGGTLNVTGTLGATSLRFGTTSGGLDPAQLALISVNGSGLGTYTLDASGYLVAGGASPYDTWAGGAAFDADANNDGVKNGLAWLLGSANKDADATALLPKVSNNAGGLVLIFDCLSAANRGTAVLNVQHSNDLGQLDLWADALVPGTAPDTVTVSGVDFVTTTNGALIHVVATIPAGNAAAGKLFGRLNATYTP